LPNGDLHGCYDKPAIVHSDGSRAWLQDNKFNRANDLPARIIAREDIHGSKLIDVLLQEEAPDIMRCFRSNQHFVYTNIFSRYDMQLSTYTEYQQYLDIANATVDAVTLYWYRQNVIHRDNDRPAIVRYDNTQEWYTDGARHRLDRPAVIWANGRREWWRSGMYLRMDVIHDDVLYE
jgi:hypothetical protein